MSVGSALCVFPRRVIVKLLETFREIRKAVKAYLVCNFTHIAYLFFQQLTSTLESHPSDKVIRRIASE